MDYTYSSGQSPGGTLHLSPSHIHHIDSLAAVTDLRRSLSRSPSKLHPHFMSRQMSPSPTNQSTPVLRRTTNMTLPVPSTQYGSADFTFPASAKKIIRPTFKRTTPLRMLSHTPARTPSKTPMRRALSDASDHGNSSNTSTLVYRGDGQENSSSPDSPDTSPVDNFGQGKDDNTPFVRVDASISPFNFSLTPSRGSNTRSGRFNKSSPLKRSDGIPNLDRGYLGSPSGKRKIVSGGFSSSPFDITSGDKMMVDSQDGVDAGMDTDDEGASNDTVGSPPPARLFTLRRSTRLADRPGMNRSRRSVDATLDMGRSPRLFAKTRSRASLDSGLPLSMSAGRDLYNNPDDTFSPVSIFRDSVPMQQNYQPLSPIAPSPIKEDNLQKKNDDLFQKPAMPKVNFSRSLPIGAVRPKPRSLRGIQDLSHDQEFSTPEAYKIAKPNPAAFMSTGLISKRHRNVDDMPAPPGSLGMPDTPCKKLPLGFSFQTSPAPIPSISKPHFPQPSFGTPSKPFSIHSSRATPTTFGKSANIFGSSLTPASASLNRRASFASIDGEDCSQSPLHADSQSSADELPPTPTKHNTSLNHPKPNSLRSKLLGRRPTVNTNTFLPPSSAEQQSLQTSCKSSPTGSETNSIDNNVDCSGTSGSSSLLLVGLKGLSLPSLARSRLQQQPRSRGLHSPSSKRTLKGSCLNPCTTDITKTPSPSPVFNTIPGSGGMSPRTPAEGTFQFPDPSNLSISPRPNQPSTPFLTPAMHNSQRHAPETPTHRDSEANAQQMSLTPSNHVILGHDVDADLLSRFSKAEWYGKGEFSEVYKVSVPFEVSMSQGYFSATLGTKPSHTPKPEKVYIVKKSRVPFTSSKVRERKLREVKAMQNIGNSEHIVQLIAHWEASYHLYIQLEFCEEGSLEDFLFKTGRNGRLDDFRIWKILIELCDGIKHIHDANYIHLDLKPANVFIDFGGVLKIGDFGMAASLPVSGDVEGEGDRRYIGPDLLQGHFDKPADIFALGMMMFEIATNVIPPDNGASWQKLRSGDWSGLPSLTSGSSIGGGSQGDLESPPVGDEHHTSQESLYNPITLGLPTMSVHGVEEIVQPPSFMVDAEDNESLDRLVQWMMTPHPAERPTVDQILMTGGVHWVKQRRRSGATIFEGAWGPTSPALSPYFEVLDSEMLDA